MSVDVIKSSGEVYISRATKESKRVQGLNTASHNSTSLTNLFLKKKTLSV